MTVKKKHLKRQKQTKSTGPLVLHFPLSDPKSDKAADFFPRETYRAPKLSRLPLPRVRSESSVRAVVATTRGSQSTHIIHTHTHTCVYINTRKWALSLFRYASAADRFSDALVIVFTVLSRLSAFGDHYFRDSVVVSSGEALCV